MANTDANTLPPVKVAQINTATYDHVVRFFTDSLTFRTGGTFTIPTTGQTYPIGIPEKH